MRLKTIILGGFRSYKDTTRIEVGDLTAFVGRNDAGKSTILEALEIFFNSEQIKIDKGDRCVHSDSGVARIGCVFTDLPPDVADSIVIDSRSQTSLRDEFLLNADGDLEIHKLYDLSKSKVADTVVAVVHHPTSELLRSLLQKKNDELKTLAKDCSADMSGVDLRSNVALRKAIRKAKAPFEMGLVEIAVEDSDDVKTIWKRLEPYLPLYALFRADRPSVDGDDEVQNPLRIAVQQAIKEVAAELKKVEDGVRAKALDVATRTLAKLQEMAPELASELKPEFKAEPKWDKQFAFTLTGDHGIPINKRGSGVRRLILLNFFRAEADRRRTEANAPSLIYAVEEPETSQNPYNQRLLMEAFKDLSIQPNIQVLITTHTPGIVGLMPKEDIRHIQQSEEGCATVYGGTEDVYARVAHELGITADRRLQAFLCVEGESDVKYLCKFAALLREEDDTVVDLSADPRICFRPLNGGNLKSWVANNYMRDASLFEMHVYDRGTDATPKYQAEVDAVNARGNSCWAVLLRRNEIENYLHPAAVEAEYGFPLVVEAATDVPREIEMLRRAEEGLPLDALAGEELERKMKKLEKAAKSRLETSVLPKMTLAQLREVDADGEIAALLRRISASLS